MSLRTRAVALLVALHAAACGGGTAPPEGPAPRRVDVTPASSAPRAPTSPAQPVSGRVGSPKVADRRAATATAPDSLGVIRGRSAKPPQTSAEIYKTAAPAVVIIRSGGGMGSGVIVDPEGWVLTNHHVVAGGERVDFTIKVTVILGKLDGPTGSMERQPAEYTAYVHKADKLRDLALLKLQDPPPGLPAIRIADENPVPGQPVLAIGHAGAGMLWAIKPGEISALGKLRDHLATLAQFRDDDEGRKAQEQFRKYLDDQNLGLVIQSTCPILPGDSGGPLLSRTGELVGLNAFSNRDPRTGGLLNFHIHRQELASFVADRPARAVQMVPDPWKEGGAELSVDDADFDGSVDTILMQGRRACLFCPRQSGAVLIDLDQNSYPAGAVVPPPTELYEKRQFDAELVYLELEGKAYVWYDTDDDGHHDVLLTDDTLRGETTGAYRIARDGSLARDEELIRGRDVRMSLFPQESWRRRLAAVAGAAFVGRNVEAGGDVDWVRPVPGSGEARAEDLDRDGQRESLRIVGPFSTKLFVDADRNTVPRLPGGFFVIGRDVPPSDIDAELAVLSQSNQMWVWYDTDDDGRYDLVLHAPGQRTYVAVAAFRVDATGRRTPAPEHLGRKLVRSGLLPAGDQRVQMASTVRDGFLGILASSDEGLASFPDLVKDSRGASYELYASKALPRGVIALAGQGSEGYLVDLEERALRGKKPEKVNLTELVEQGKVKADFAWFQRGGLAWAYYDTDGKDGYDVVLFTGDPFAGRATQGYRIGKQGAVVDPELAGRPMVRPSLLARTGQRKKLSLVAAELFSERSRE